MIGAGFIGLEIAATARTLGVEVTLVEAGPCPLAGSARCRARGVVRAACTRAEGVNVLTDVTVDRVDANGSVRALRLSDGVAVAVDHVVVGVGIAAGRRTGSPAAGSTSPRGVPVDAHGRTAIEGVFAAGDAAATFDAALRHVMSPDRTGRRRVARALASPARCSGSTRAPRR